MQHTLQSAKRVFSAAVAAATIAFTAGVAGIVAPSTAKAASAGDLIKGSLSTVYYYGYDGMRYTFPNEKTYMTWFSDFDDVTEISDSTLASLELAGNVVYRPGSYWVKITTDPKVYAVATDGSIHWIEDEDVAEGYAGSDWASRVQDVPDAFFVDYTVGASLMAAEAFDGMLYMDGGSYYLAWGGEKRMVSSAGRSANGLDADFFLDGSGIDDSSLTEGSDVAEAATALMDPAQTEAMEDEEETSGDLEIELSSSTSSGATVPQGSNSVEVFSFDVTAGSEDGSLDALVVTQGGAGSTSDISNAYLYEGNSRLTEARSVNASTRAVTFSNLDLSIDAGDSRTFTVRVEVSSTATAADTFSFSIESADDITASGDVDGDFPVEGNEFTVSGQDAGSITLTKSGTITNPTIGEGDAVIGEFKLVANSEPASVEMVTLKIDDAVDHSDFWLWDGSTALVAGEWLGADQVLFDLSDEPFEIAESGSNIFSVSADIGGQDADTVKVYLDNNADLVAVGGELGFGMSITNTSYDGTSCTATTGNCSYSVVQGGEVTLARTGPVAGDINTNSQDETLLEFTITSGEEVTIKDLDIIVYGDDDATVDGDAFDGVNDAADDNTGLVNTGAEGNLKDIKIINADTGAVLWGPLELDGVAVVADGTTCASSPFVETSPTLCHDSGQIIDFTEDLTFDGTLNLVVTADVDNGVTSGTAFGAAVDISGLSIEDANGDALASADIVPSSNINGFNQMARSASLTVSLASTPGSVSTVKGAQDVLVNAFNVVGGLAGEVNISTIEISVYSDTVTGTDFTLGDHTTAPDVNDYISSCELYDIDGVLIAAAEAPASNGQTITYTGLDWTIAANETQMIKVYCDLANPSSSTTYFFAFDLDDVSEDIVAEDQDGNDVDPTSDDPNGATAATNEVSIAANGTLSMAAGSDMPSADFVLTSSSDNRVANFRFTAATESFTVTTLSVSEEQAEDDTGTADSSAYANNISLVTLAYEDEDGATVESTATMNGNEAKFTGLSIPVVIGSPADVDVYVNVPLTDRDSGGTAKSNEKVRMGLFADTTNDDNFRAIGSASGTALDDDDVTVIGDDSYATDSVPTFVVRETKPTIALSSSSPSGALVPGLQEVLRFNVSAASNEDVVMDEVIFKFSATDNGSTDWNMYDPDAGLAGDDIDTPDFSIYNLDEQGTTAQLEAADTEWSILESDGSTNDQDEDVAFVLLNLATMEIIPKGDTYSYALYFDSTGASAGSDDAIRFDIVSDPIVSTTTGYLAATTISDAAITRTDATLTLADGTTVTEGDVVCFTGADTTCATTEEIALVTGVSGNNVTFARGYLGRNLALQVTTQNVRRLPGTFLWQDDGSTSLTTSNEEYWGSYLVDNLTVNGNTILF